MTDLSPLLRIRDAHVRRAGREILAVDEFSLAEGESAALLGPNGSGKSTFIGLITREIHPLHRDEAPVLFRGDARVTLADIKRALGVVSSTMQDQIRVHVPAQDIVAGGLFGSLGDTPALHGNRRPSALAPRAIMSELGIGRLGRAGYSHAIHGPGAGACSSPGRSCTTRTSSSSTNPARDSTPKECTMFGKR